MADGARSDEPLERARELIRQSRELMEESRRLQAEQEEILRQLSITAEGAPFGEAKIEGSSQEENGGEGTG